MQLLADIWVQVPTGKIKEPFTYIVPEELSFITPGWRVLVPWGPRMMEGVVLSISTADSSEISHKLRAIHKIIEDSPFYSQSHIELAEWLANRYFCTLGEALRLFVPGGKEGKDEPYYSWQLDSSLDRVDIKDLELAKHLKEKECLSRSNLIRQFGPSTLASLARLLKAENITKDVRYKKLSRIQEETFCQISEAGKLAFAEGTIRGEQQKRLLNVLSGHAELNRKELLAQGISRDSMKRALEKGWITESCRLDQQETSTQFKERDYLLTADQEQVCGEIEKARQDNRFAEFLLLGVTGSGKTEIYLEMVRRVREKSQGAIILVPEIALTSQLVQRFEERFGSDIVVFHSSISLGEKRTGWERIRRGEAGIVIGARSALFAPLTNLGIIILDEEHEFTYKQEEHPRYHARDAARKRAELENGILLLGSATPSLESYHRSQSDLCTLLQLPERIGGRPLADVEVVDLREELKKGNKTMFSRALQGLIQETLEKKEQMILLINRRGHSTFVMCRECGYVATCPDCHVSLVYHQGKKTMECHYCHTHHSVPDICPKCSSSYIKFFGTGTEKVETGVRNLWPEARIARLDQDTTSRKGSAATILADFRAGKIDVLIGTQMVAKGHDIPNVTTIGVISADTVLHIPDFRAAEQTFDLLTQVAGRAGRGDKPGRVVIQTYSPEEASIQAAAKQNYTDFAEAELENRKALEFPPYSTLFRCTIHDQNEKSVREKIWQIQDELEKCSISLEILGPYPEVLQYHRTSSRWYQHLLVKTNAPDELTGVFRKLRKEFETFLKVDRDPIRIF